MAGLVVKPRARIFHGHEWVYGSEIKKVFGEPNPGDVISLKDFKDRPLGSAIYNPHSQIVARRFSRRRQDLDREFFDRRLQRALQYREELNLQPPGFARLVWSESDGLPGVIVDRYGDVLVLQTNTLAMDQRKDLITESLAALLAPRAIVERNDSPIRKPEGLEASTGLLLGTAPEPAAVELEGFRLSVDLLEGQKTGLYLDQWDNYGAVAALASGRRVLDCFANQGGFALACAARGAAAATAVESSAPALAAGKSNAEASGLEVEFIEENAFDYLKEAQAAENQFDLIVLDPPSFTRSKSGVKDALRGYKEIHLRSLKILSPEGILATFCCSHHISREQLLEVTASASVDAKRQLRRIAEYTQRADHPIVATIPETEYLKGFAFQAFRSW